jgi:sepiapterin reductase
VSRVVLPIYALDIPERLTNTIANQFLYQWDVSMRRKIFRLDRKTYQHFDSVTMNGEALCVVVTGASRGLGRAIAVEFARLPNVRSLILIARTTLDATKEEAAAVAQRTEPDRSNLNVITIQADLGNLETLDETIATISEEVRKQQQQESEQHNVAPQRLIFINNAGSLGFIGRATEIPSIRVVQSAIDLNVTSALWMAVCLTKSSSIPQPTSSTLIVNISSMVAIQPFPSLALYSAGKAARDAFFQAMAAEEPPRGSPAAATTTTIKTLNYAPGPLETDMTEEMRSCERLDESLKPHYAKQLVHPTDSARVLVELVQKNEFESGRHIDYYDVVQQ